MVLTKNKVKLHELATPDDVYTKITLPYTLNNWRV